MNRKKFFLLCLIGLLVVGFFHFDLGRYLTLDFIKSQQEAINRFYLSHPLQTVAVYFAIYVAMTGLSLPGAVVMTLVGGAVFGVVWGTVIVSFASTLGATLAFLASRYLFREMIQSRFGDKLKAIDAGIEKEGAFYLFTLRLVPAFPFFIINLVMGLTAIRTGVFMVVSQVGMLAGTVVYVNAGTQIAQLDGLSGILSLQMIGSFILLGLFPLLAKQGVRWFQLRKILAPYSKPKTFDRNLIAIGAGAAGLVTTYIGAAVQAKVTLIEKHKMGGDCLNTGCVPSKALIRSAKFLAHAKKADTLGFRSAKVTYAFAEVMERVQRVIRTVEPHDSVERYTALGVECIQGEARILSPWHVEVNGQTLSTRNIVIATGARPAIPPIPGIRDMAPLTSDTVWNLRERPKRLLVLGAGPIGCELTQAFSRLGCETTLVLRGSRLMKKEDPEVSQMVRDRFEAEGVRVLSDHVLQKFFMEEGQKTLVCQHQGEEVRVLFDTLLVASGRQANVSGFGLEALGVVLNRDGTIQTDAYLRTTFPNIFACGDVAGPFQFTHTAAHQAWYAAVNALFGRFKRFKVDYSVIPWATFTDPEVARVGLNEQEALAQGIPHEITLYGLDDLDRAIADEEAYGMVKVLTVPGKDTILGVTIVGDHAGDIIAEYVAAMRHGFGMNKILGTIHIYPTLAEANKYAAGVWKKAHVSPSVMVWLEKFHRWSRG
ncbi:MAG: FAD-dependent oxidoreductase [Magnetococcales bacterium]|nr:FAD-dependent oxidoreductase [Magnetococcales bacterium]